MFVFLGLGAMERRHERRDQLARLRMKSGAYPALNTELRRRV
jgi:hypothetical protein